MSDEANVEAAIAKERSLERVALVRVVVWAIMSLVVVPVVFFGFSALWVKLSVFYLVEISHYANGATDFSAWQGARAARRGLENPPPS